MEKNFEKRFDIVDKLLGEIDTLKQEVARLSKLNEGFRRFEVEQKKKCIFVKGLASNTTKKLKPDMRPNKELTNCLSTLT